MKRLLTLIAASLGFAALAACGPIYDTEYTYHAPRDPGGRACVSSCDADQSQCKYQCRRETQDCENEKRRVAEREFNRYARWRRDQNLPVDKNVYDFTPGYSCPWESECSDVCESSYRACFTGCGGTIDARQVCVMGCSQQK